MRIEIALAIFAAKVYAQDDLSDCKFETIQVPRVDSDGNPVLDGITLQQVIDDVEQCFAPETGLQWDRDAAPNANLFELYLDAQGNSQSRLINNDNWTGDITLAKRNQMAGLYFLRPVTDYDGCYNRYIGTTETLDGYWALQTVIDTNESAIQSQIANMCVADKCMYDQIELYLNQSWSAEALTVGTSTYPAWTTYLLAADRYTLNVDASTVAGEATVAASAVSSTTSWKAETKALRDYNKAYITSNCTYQGQSSFASRVSSSNNWTTINDYYTTSFVAPAVAFSTASSSFDTNFNDWSNTKQPAFETADYDSQKAAANSSGKFVLPVVGTDLPATGSTFSSWYNSAIPNDVKTIISATQQVVDDAVTNTSATLTTKRTEASTAEGLYTASQSEYTTACQYQKEKDAWDANKSAIQNYFTQYDAYHQDKVTQATNFSFQAWTPPSNIQSLMSTLLNWGNLDPTLRNADTTARNALKNASPNDVAYAQAQLLFDDQNGTTTNDWASKNNDFNTYISSILINEYQQTERDRINGNASSVPPVVGVAENEKTQRVAAAKTELISLFGNNPANNWIAFNSAIQTVQVEPEKSAVLSAFDATFTSNQSSLYQIMLQRKLDYETAQTNSQTEYALYAPWEKQYAAIARTEKSDAIESASGQTATDLNNEIGQTNDASNWNKYASYRLEQYEAKLDLEATALTNYWNSIVNYVAKAQTAWNFYEESHAATAFSTATALATAFCQTQRSLTEAICTEKRAVADEWDTRKEAQQLIVDEFRTTYDNWQYYSDELNSCSEGDFRTQRQAEYALYIAKARAEWEREDAILDIIKDGQTKTRATADGVCTDYDLWDGRYNSYADDVHSPFPFTQYDCSLISGYSWCDGAGQFVDERPCTLTKADYDLKVAAVSDFHQESQLTTFNECACDGQSTSCLITPFGQTKPVYTFTAPLNEPPTVTLGTFDFGTMWSKSRQAVDLYKEYDNITPLQKQALVISTCKADWASYQEGIRTAESNIIDAEAKQQLTDPTDWVKQNYLYDTYWQNYSLSGSGSISSAFSTVTVSNSDGNSRNERGLQSLDINAPAWPTTSSTPPTVVTARNDKIIYDSTTSGNSLVNWLDNFEDLYRPVEDGFMGASKEQGIGPVALMTCENVDGKLGGMQVYFGQYMHKAGASHGDMTGTCNKQLLEERIRCIEFFYDTVSTNVIVGVNATMWPARDGADAPVSISAGLVGTVGAKSWNYCYPAQDTTQEFFGFESTTDSTFAITQLKVINYKPVDLFLALHSSTEQSAAASQRDSGSMAAYRNIIVNDLIGQIATPTGQADVNGVYRPEQYRQDLEIINIAIAQIDNQKAADAAAASESETSAADAEATALDNETASELTASLLDHSEEEREANTGALVAAIIGGIILIGLLAFCCMRMCMDKKRSEMMNTAGRGGSQAIRVNNSSFRSDGQANQGKLDDIM